ncbi:glycoside hydrolase family 97 protein [bacterium]|nr:glycoside hydrolase family 97 protein [bacterium]
MKKGLILFWIFLIGVHTSAQTIKSPSKKLALHFSLSVAGEPTYSLTAGTRDVIRTSRLGIELKDQPALLKDFTVIGTDTSCFDETWKPVWGEVKEIRNHYRELAVTLQQKDAGVRGLTLRFRLFDDGLGFRYEFEKSGNLNFFTVSDERTEFNLTGDHKTFWIPGDYDSQEYFYQTTPLSQVNAFVGKQFDEIGVKTIPADNVVQTPLLMKTSEGLYLAFHEAALIDYPAMHLDVNRQVYSLRSHLVPDAVGNKAYLQAPARTPWRTVIVSEKAADILASKVILNLNEPSKIADTSWIRPMKYVGIWWEMHVGKSSWNYADTDNTRLAGTDWAGLKPNGRHGANTENTRRFIDFAAANGFGGVLVEGWNIGWEDWYGHWKEEVFDFVTPYPDFDLEALKKYAAKKGVELIMHHETSSSATNYERRMDEAFRFMKAHGYDAVKTGYVGRIIPRGEHHDGQWMVNHYLRVAEKAAGYRIMVNSHEAVRPTGLHRTYPNWLASESGRGNEYSAWSRGNPPEHETLLPFTRLLGGPMDYTPGIFQIKMDKYQPGSPNQVHTTLAKQLALYVTLACPIQMAADLVENYQRFPDAFQFIRDVAVDWDDTRIVEAEPGDYITIARKARGREEWFIGAITDENSRESVVPLEWLAPEKTYVAAVYADGEHAHWKDNPADYRISRFLVNQGTVLHLSLACGGGAAVSLKPASGKDLKTIESYPGQN